MGAIIDFDNLTSTGDMLDVILDPRGTADPSSPALLDTVYTISEATVAACSTFGNSLIVISFLRDSRLRTPTNMYVFSLALADLLVSIVGIPIYLYSMITGLPSDYLGCLIVNTWIMMLCTVSIFHLVAVSYDRYLAVVWLRQPDSRKDRIRHAAWSIASAWICGTIVGLLPLMGWNRGPSRRNMCDFMEIMDMRYLLFLFYFTIITPTFLMAFFYASIFHVVRRQDARMARQFRRAPLNNNNNNDEVDIDGEPPAEASPLNSSPTVRQRERAYLSVRNHNSMASRVEPSSLSPSLSESRMSSTQWLDRRQPDDSVTTTTGSSIGGHHHLRRHPTVEKNNNNNNSSLRKKSSKSRRVILSFLLVIVSFLLSWYPLYILNALTYYAPSLRIDRAAFYGCIVLSHLSTTVNPMIYARTMPGFREVIRSTLRCEKLTCARRRSSKPPITFCLLDTQNSASAKSVISGKAV